jgi:hypothetical protein
LRRVFAARFSYAARAQKATERSVNPLSRRLAGATRRDAARGV